MKRTTGTDRTITRNWRKATQAVRAGTWRSEQGETSEALFLTSGFAYDTAETAAARFRGEAAEPRAGVRSGHMPGALNLPFDQVVNGGGTLKSVDELRAVFGHVDLDRPIVTTCGSGVTASVLALALARLGRFDVAVYDGSWTEWGGRADTPIVTGA